MEFISFVIRTIIFLAIINLLSSVGMWDRISLFDVIATIFLFVSAYGIGPLGFIDTSEFFDEGTGWDFGDGGGDGSGF